MKIPQFVYKYQGTNENSILSLKQSGIYFGRVEKFNDPYDCNLGFHLKIDEHKLDKFIKGEPPYNKDRTVNIENEIRSLNRDNLKAIIHKVANSAITNSIQNTIKNFGVSCFSEVNDNLLMWSHYANSAKGFCLEFDTRFEPFNKIFKVAYNDELPELDAMEIISSEDYSENRVSETSKLWLTKSIDWKYEQEWRIIHQKKDTIFTYAQEALRAVYFGPLINRHYLEIICLILQGQNKNVKFFLGRISKEKFKVEFEEIKYTPFINKK